MDSSRGVVRFRPKAERVIRIKEDRSIALGTSPGSVESSSFVFLPAVGEVPRI